MSRLVALLLSLSLLGSSSSGVYEKKLVDRVSLSIVRITGEMTVMTFEGPMTGHYVCTGFVLAVDEVMTAGHCAVGTQMRADGRDVQKVLRLDKVADLALLKVETRRPPLKIREREAERFEAVTAIGYGFGWDQVLAIATQVLLTAYSPCDECPPGLIMQPGFIGGMSGGPIVDQDGQLIGIVQQANEGIGYGVGSLIIRAFLVGL